MGVPRGTTPPPLGDTLRGLRGPCCISLPSFRRRRCCTLQVTWQQLDALHGFYTNREDPPRGPTGTAWDPLGYPERYPWGTGGFGGAGSDEAVQTSRQKCWQFAGSQGYRGSPGYPGVPLGTPVYASTPAVPRVYRGSPWGRDLGYSHLLKFCVFCTGFSFSGVYVLLLRCFID